VVRIHAAGASVHVTASTSSPLGPTPRGATADLAAWKTGMVDVADSVYYVRHAQLLAWETDIPQTSST
jgi:hypothetical protein